jgi:hypothetical protein
MTVYALIRYNLKKFVGDRYKLFIEMTQLIFDVLG